MHRHSAFRLRLPKPFGHRLVMWRMIVVSASRKSSSNKSNTANLLGIRKVKRRWQSTEEFKYIANIAHTLISNLSDSKRQHHVCTCEIHGQRSKPNLIRPWTLQFMRYSDSYMLDGTVTDNKLLDEKSNRSRISNDSKTIRDGRR